MAGGSPRPWGITLLWWHGQCRGDPGVGRNVADVVALLCSDFSRILLEHRHRQQQSCPPGPLPAVAAGHGATRDGEHLAVALILQGGVPGKEPTLAASTPPVPVGPQQQPRSGTMQAAALVLSTRPPSPACGCSLGLPPCLRWEPWYRLLALSSLPALPVPNCERGRQELQAVLCQQLPGGQGGKDPSDFSPPALGCVQNALGMC